MANDIIRAAIELETVGDTRYPTTDRRSLRIMEGVLAAEIELRVERVKSEDLPTDVLAATLRLVDAAGAGWQSTSRFTTAALVVHMIDLEAADGMLFWAQRAQASFKAAFAQGPVIDRARFSSDDRFHRIACVGEEIVRFKFHYTTLQLTLAVHGEEMLSNLAVRMNGLSFQGNELADLGYHVAWPHLLRWNTAVYSQEYRAWMDSPIPMPLTFEPTPSTGLEAQECVTVDR